MHELDSRPGGAKAFVASPNLANSASACLRLLCLLIKFAEFPSKGTIYLYTSRLPARITSNRIAPSVFLLRIIHFFSHVLQLQ